MSRSQYHDDLSLDTIAEHLQRNIEGLSVDVYWLRLAAILRAAAQYGRQTGRSDRWQRAVEIALRVEYPAASAERTP